MASFLPLLLDWLTIFSCPWTQHLLGLRPLGFGAWHPPQLPQTESHNQLPWFSSLQRQIEGPLSIYLPVSQFLLSPLMHTSVPLLWQLLTNLLIILGWLGLSLAEIWQCYQKSVQSDSHPQFLVGTTRSLEDHTPTQKTPCLLHFYTPGSPCSLEWWATHNSVSQVPSSGTLSIRF